MKILYISNNEEYSYEEMKLRDRELYFFLESGHDILALGRHDFFRFYSLYKRFKPDLIISSWVPAGFVPALLKKVGLIKTPIIHWWDEYYQIQMTNYPSRIVGFLERFTVKNSDVLTTASRYNELRGIKMKKKIFYIPHGVEPEIKKTKINLDSLKTSTKNLKIIHLGDQFTKFKKVDKIVLGVKDLDCDLFLFGKTNEELIPLAGKNVHFMGHLDQKEIPSMLKQADILINGADMDHNFKLFDYIQAGKPIIAVDGKPAYVFKHGENAFLTNDFSSGLKILIGDKGLREKLEENVKKIPTKTWGEVVEAHLEICEKLI